MIFEDQQDREALKSILLSKSVRFGEFTLTSGQKSNVYVDAKLTTCSSEAMPLIGRLFLRRMIEAGWAPHAVGGLTLGADSISYCVARESFELTGRHIDAFIVRKEAKKHGMQRFIEGMDSVAGMPVVIIDDVCSTGGSTVQAIQKAQESGMKILGAICLVDREMGAPGLLRMNHGCALLSVFTLSEIQASQPVETRA